MSFINSLFLFATGAALLPILYHLIQKMRARKVRFSSLMFLRATPKALIKRRRLRDLLLMIVRACILGFLALAFARPFIPREKIPLIPQEAEVSRVILLDNSFSMQYGDLFERAKAEAVGVLDHAGAGDETALIVFSDKPVQVSELSTDIPALKELVTHAVAVSNRTTDLEGPLKFAEEILKDARHEAREIVLISDFQASALANRPDTWKLDEAITLVPRKITADNMANTWISRLVQEQKRIGESAAVQFRLQIDSQGAVPGQREVALWLNGREVDRNNPDAMQSQVIFQQAGLRKGNYQGYVALNRDDLAVDNVHYVTFAVEKRPSVYCIDGSLSSDRSNAFYIGKCFSMGEQARYDFASGGPERLNSSLIRSQNIVFLADVSSLSAAQVALIRQFVEGGGGVVISFGDHANLERWSGHLAELGVGRLAGKVTARTALSSGAMVGEVDFKHPVFSVFSASGMGDLSRPRFREYANIIPDTSAVVIGTYATGDPFMVERVLGKGKILVLTSTLNTDWGDFPVNEIYLPFVYQMVRYELSSTEIVTAFSVGDPVPLSGNPGDTWEVRAPDDKMYKAAIDRTGTGYFRETEVPGNYQAANGREQRNFSVNVDTRESDLASQDEMEIRAAFSGQTNQTVRETRQADLGTIAEEEKDQKLWRYLMLFIVALFLFETFFANWKAPSREKSQLSPSHHEA